MKIVGTGCGPGMLTTAAIRVIAGAILVVGSERAIDLAREYISKTAETRIITDYRSLRELPDHAVLLSTGDPMLSGLGYLPGEVIPGISSVQYAAAQLHIPLTETVIITAHGRDTEPAISEVVAVLTLGWTACVIADPDFSIETLALSLQDLPFTNRIILCEDLGYPTEQIRHGTPANPPQSDSGMYILFIRAGEKTEQTHT
jgi:cobalt-precorrin-7 (C5)-methyltransferase